MKLEELFDGLPDAFDALADYDYPDSDYFDALEIAPSDDDPFDDLTSVFDMARAHGIKPDDFAEMTDDSGMYVLLPSKVAESASVLAGLKILSHGSDARIFSKFWREGNSIGICIESKSLNFQGFQKVKTLVSLIQSGHSVSLDITSNGNARIEISVAGAAVKM